VTFIERERGQIGHGRRILVVDGEPLLGEALCRLFLRVGYEPQVTFTAEHAEFVASAGRFDCAIIDVHLGDDDGIELARRLVETARVRRVVFYSARLDVAVIDRASSVGAWVHKAARFEELAAAVELALA
jgi:DNA-binding response OmpR family regulator